MSDPFYTFEEFKALLPVTCSYRVEDAYKLALMEIERLRKRNAALLSESKCVANLKGLLADSKTRLKCRTLELKRSRAENARLKQPKTS